MTCDICGAPATATAHFDEPRPADFTVCDAHAGEAAEHGHAEIKELQP